MADKVNTPKQYMLKLLKRFAAYYVVFAWLLMISSFFKPVERLFFYPNDKEYGKLKDINKNGKDLFFDAPDGSKLHGWFLPAEGRAVGLVIHSHGNAANVTNHASMVADFCRLGFHVFCFDYRGYGKSEGKASWKNAREDCLAALDYAYNNRELLGRRMPVFWFGQSFGAALALDIAAKDERISAVAVESPFGSARNMPMKVWNKTIFLWPWSWMARSALVDDNFEPIRLVREISPRPLLILHGEADEVVPYSESMALYENAREPKEFITEKDFVHLEFMQQHKYVKIVADFFRKAAGN